MVGHLGFFLSFFFLIHENLLRHGTYEMCALKKLTHFASHLGNG